MCIVVDTYLIIYEIYYNYHMLTNQETSLPDLAVTSCCLITILSVLTLTNIHVH